MFDGQRQLAQHTNRASTNQKGPETQSRDNVLVHVNPPTFISIHPSVLLDFCLQPGFVSRCGRAYCNV